MLKEAQHLPAVKAMLDQANKVLGWDLLDVCLNGKLCDGTWTPGFCLLPASSYEL